MTKIQTIHVNVTQWETNLRVKFNQKVSFVLTGTYGPEIQNCSNNKVIILNANCFYYCRLNSNCSFCCVFQCLLANNFDQHISLDCWIKGRISKAVLLETACIVRRFLSLEPTGGLELNLTPEKFYFLFLNNVVSFYYKCIKYSQYRNKCKISNYQLCEYSYSEVTIFKDNYMLFLMVVCF